MSFNLFAIHLDDVRGLCERYHGYASAGGVAVYAFGVHEGGRLVAAYAWQPPPPGAAASVCPEAPYGVLALSRMVAVPKTERELKHISKPLKYQPGARTAGQDLGGPTPSTPACLCGASRIEDKC